MLDVLGKLQLQPGKAEKDFKHSIQEELLET